MADRWYLKGIHVPVNRFGSEENKKTGIAYKPDGTCLQQLHSRNDTRCREGGEMCRIYGGKGAGEGGRKVLLQDNP